MTRPAIRTLLFLFILCCHSTGRSQAVLKSPGVALVLSGGGAKGLAHIGILEVLDSANIPINLIVGTSIGASIGGLYAAGYTPQQLEQFALSTNWYDVLDLDQAAHRNERVLKRKDMNDGVLSLRFTGLFHPVLPQAISTGERLTMLLNTLVINAPSGVPHNFLTDLRVPFAAVATDIVSGERRVITQGDLTQTLRASATLPLRFNPLATDTAILMDGGLIANIPVDVARDFHPGMVIVSNTTASLRSRKEIATPWDVADQVISLMMARQNKAQLANADIVLTPQLSESAEDFNHIEKMIEAGRAAARIQLPSIKELLRLQPPLPEMRIRPTSDTILPVIQSIRIHGYEPTADQNASRLFAQWYGMPLVRTDDTSALPHHILSYFHSAGYTLARVDSVLIDSAHEAADFYVDEGRIGALQISGIDYNGSNLVHPDVVFRELPLYAHDVFTSAAAERGLHNLTGTGLFNFASIEISHDTLWPGTVWKRGSFGDPPLQTPLQNDSLRFGPMVKVAVEVKAANVIRLGILADNEFGAQFSTELANEDIGGTGMYISIKGGLGPLSRYAALTLDAPQLFRSFAAFNIQAYSGYKDISQYFTSLSGEGKILSEVKDVVRESRNIGGSLNIGGELGKIGAITVGIRREKQEWFSVRNPSGPVNHMELSAFRASFAFDSRDDAFYPHTGGLISGYFESGLKLFGGEASYTKLYAELEQAIPLSTLHTIKPSIAIGFGDVPLPRLEQFSLGGLTSFYGLNEYELRGRQVLHASMTYQIAIPHILLFPTFVSLRYDLGSTWPEPAAIKWEALVHGIGAQVGMETPIGLARFGIGENFRFSVDKNYPLDLNKPRFYFSFGANL